MIWTVPFCFPGNAINWQSTLGHTSHKPERTAKTSVCLSVCHMTVTWGGCTMCIPTSWVGVSLYCAQKFGVGGKAKHMDFCHQYHYQSAWRVHVWCVWMEEMRKRGNSSKLSLMKKLINYLGLSKKPLTALIPDLHRFQYFGFWRQWRSENKASTDIVSFPGCKEWGMRSEVIRMGSTYLSLLILTESTRVENPISKTNLRFWSSHIITVGVCVGVM